MTAISIWLNNENPKHHSLWIASDSRVSKSQNSTLIDDGAKIFALPVVCRVPRKNGFFSQIDYFHSYGYCFAGSTLLGQNTFLALMPLLGNLAASQSYIPDMPSVANFILRYLGRAFDNYKIIACEKSAVEVALFGWCHATQKYYIFHYYPGENDDGVVVMKCTVHTNLQEKCFVYLGDHKQDMTQKIKQGFDEKSIPGRLNSRIPRHIIEDHIRDSDYTTIGGDIQLGIADMSGFRPFSIGKPRVDGQPGAYLSYLGHELYDEIRNVGHAFISMPGMF